MMFDLNAWGTAGIGAFLFAIVMIWSIVWKGLALWKAARLGHKWWFVAILVISTAGILDILYIYFFSKKVKDGKKDPVVKDAE